MKPQKWHEIKRPKILVLCEKLAELCVEANKRNFYAKVRKAKNMAEHVTGRTIDVRPRKD